MRLLVYGSLMSGQGNHRFLVDARFVRVARTAPAYTLVSLGAFPAMLEGGDMAVRGEIYDVNDATLVRLDRLEGAPRFYERKHVRLRTGVFVEAYVLPRERASSYPVVESGDWRDACASR